MKQALFQTFAAVAAGALIGWTTADFWGVPAILSGAGFAIAGFFFVYQLRTGVGVLRPTWAKWRKRGPFFALILFLAPAEIPAFQSPIPPPLVEEESVGLCVALFVAQEDGPE